MNKSKAVFSPFNNDNYPYNGNAFDYIGKFTNHRYDLSQHCISSLVGRPQSVTHIACLREIFLVTEQHIPQAGGSD